MNFETLESRNLLADIGFTGILQVTSRGSLYVAGTAGNDRITVTRAQGGVAVNVNGLTYNYGSDVKRIFVDAKAGDDRVTIKIARRSNVLGGEGNDTLIGGGADDSLDGGEGSNRLYGRGGVNAYTAVAGNNVIFSERLVGETPDRVAFGDDVVNASLQPIVPGEPNETVLTSSAGTTVLVGAGITFQLTTRGA